MVYLFVKKIVSDNKIRERVHYIDFLKFIASFFVIFSHCLMKFVLNFDESPLFNLIWITQMPLFMFLAGLCETKGDNIATVKLLLKRLAKNFLILVVPCFTYMIFKRIIFNISVADQFVDFYNNPDSNLWFLWVLFLIHLIFEIGIYIHKKINKKWSIVIPFILSSITCVSIFIMMFVTEMDFSILGLKYLSYYLIFFCFGYLFKLVLNSNIMLSKITQILIWIGSLVALGVLLFVIFYFKSIYSFSDTNIVQVIVRLMGSVASIVVFMVLGNLICRFSFGKKVSVLGKFSLESYYIHALLLPLLTYTVAEQSLSIQYLTAFGSTLLLSVSVTLSLLIVFFVPYSHLVIFGRSWSFYKFENRLPDILK